MKTIYSAIFFVFSGVFALGEEPVFDGKISLRAPARSSWEITLRPTSAMRIEEREKARTASLDKESILPMGPEETLVKLKVEKSGQMYQETSYFNNGTKREKWSIGSIQFRELKGRDDQLGMAGATVLDPDFSDHSKEDFEELGWLSKEFYKGIIQYENVPCFLFQTSSDKKPATRREAAVGRFLAETADEVTGATATVKPTKPTVTTVTVIISAATRLPLMYNDGRIIRLYRFETSGLAALKPPAKFASEFAAWQKHLAEVNRAPSAP